MKRPARIAIAVIAILMLMAEVGCDMSGNKNVSIDDHTFHVPQNHLIKGTIPWLPASQSAGLTFVVNPDAPLKEQWIVHIESTSKRCNPATPPASSQLSTACKAAQRQERELLWKINDLEKVHPGGYSSQWEYRLKSKSQNDQEVIVASCSGPTEEMGLCTSLSHYKDLVYSVGLRDSDVKHLPSIREKVHEMLASWEKAPES